MIGKFSEALRLLWRHLGLFSAIILTVWFPGNVLLNYVSYYVKKPADANILWSMKGAMWIEMIFSPLCIGAMVYALSRIKSGGSVTYREAITVGLRKWGSLFLARFVAGFFIGLGLLAFVVPGLMLLARYSLLDEVIILEESKPATTARARSTELTEGRRWQIVWSAILFFLCFLLTSVVVYLPLGFVESLNIMPIEVVLDCVMDIVYAVIQIVLFLYYWEAIAEERQGGPGPPSRVGPAEGISEVEAV